MPIAESLHVKRANTPHSCSSPLQTEASEFVHSTTPTSQPEPFQDTPFSCQTIWGSHDVPHQSAPGQPLHSNLHPTDAALAVTESGVTESGNMDKTSIHKSPAMQGQSKLKMVMSEVSGYANSTILRRPQVSYGMGSQDFQHRHVAEQPQAVIGTMSCDWRCKASAEPAQHQGGPACITGASSNAGQPTLEACASGTSLSSITRQSPQQNRQLPHSICMAADHVVVDRSSGLTRGLSAVAVQPRLAGTSVTGASSIAGQSTLEACISATSPARSASQPSQQHRQPPHATCLAADPVALDSSSGLTRGRSAEAVQPQQAGASVTGASSIAGQSTLEACASAMSLSRISSQSLQQHRQLPHATCLAADCIAVDRISGLTSGFSTMAVQPQQAGTSVTGASSIAGQSTLEACISATSPARSASQPPQQHRQPPHATCRAANCVAVDRSSGLTRGLSAEAVQPQVAGACVTGASSIAGQSTLEACASATLQSSIACQSPHRCRQRSSTSGTLLTGRQSDSSFISVP